MSVVVTSRRSLFSRANSFFVERGNGGNGDSVHIMPSESFLPNGTRLYTVHVRGADRCSVNPRPIPGSLPIGWRKAAAIAWAKKLLS